MMAIDTLNHYLYSYHLFRIGFFFNDYKTVVTEQYYWIVCLFLMIHYIDLNRIQMKKIYFLCNLCIFMVDLHAVYLRLEHGVTEVGHRTSGNFVEPYHDAAYGPPLPRTADWCG